MTKLVNVGSVKCLQGQVGQSEINTILLYWGLFEWNESDFFSLSPKVERVQTNFIQSIAFI